METNRSSSHNFSTVSFRNIIVIIPHRRDKAVPIAVLESSDSLCHVQNGSLCETMVGVPEIQRRSVKGNPTFQRGIPSLCLMSNCAGMEIILICCETSLITALLQMKKHVQDKGRMRAIWNKAKALDPDEEML